MARRGRRAAPVPLPQRLSRNPAVAAHDCLRRRGHEGGTLNSARRCPGLFGVQALAGSWRTPTANMRITESQEGASDGSKLAPRPVLIRFGAKIRNHTPLTCQKPRNSFAVDAAIWLRVRQHSCHLSLMKPCPTTPACNFTGLVRHHPRANQLRSRRTINLSA